MTSTMEKLSSNKIKLRIEIDAEAFNDATQQAYVKSRGRYVIQGFRKGKAPRKLIESKYGEGIFQEKAFQDGFTKWYNEAVEEKGIQAVSNPNVYVDTMGATEGLVFTAEVYVKPDVILGQYKELFVEREDETVSEEAVDEAILAARVRNGRDVEVDDRPVQANDIVTMDYSGSVDGAAMKWDTAKELRIIIGSGQYFPEFEDQIIGMEIGGEKDVHVKFPPNYQLAELVGKDAVYHVKVHHIHVRELPDLDDEFAKDMGFNTLDEYRADVRVKLEGIRKQEADDAYGVALIEAVTDRAEVDVPDVMIEHQIDIMLNDYAVSLLSQGRNIQQEMQSSGETKESLRAQYRKPAEMSVKREQVLLAIAAAEQIEPSQEEIDKRIARIAAESGKEDNQAFRDKMTVGHMQWVHESATIAEVVKLLKNEAKGPEGPEEPQAETAP